MTGATVSSYFLETICTVLLSTNMSWAVSPIFNAAAAFNLLNLDIALELG